MVSMRTRAVEAYICLENFDFKVLFFTLSFKCKLYTKKMFLFAVWGAILRK